MKDITIIDDQINIYFYCLLLSLYLILITDILEMDLYFVAIIVDGRFNLNFRWYT